MKNTLSFQAARLKQKENSSNPVVFATLDCGTAGQEICNKYDIKVTFIQIKRASITLATSLKNYFIFSLSY